MVSAHECAKPNPRVRPQAAPAGMPAPAGQAGLPYWVSVLGAALAWPSHLVAGLRATAHHDRDVRELEALDDAVLRDIGIERRNIRRIVAERHASTGGRRIAGPDWWRNL